VAGWWCAAIRLPASGCRQAASESYSGGRNNVRHRISEKALSRIGVAISAMVARRNAANMHTLAQRHWFAKRTGTAASSLQHLRTVRCALVYNGCRRLRRNDSCVLRFSGGIWRRVKHKFHLRRGALLMALEPSPPRLSMAQQRQRYRGVVLGWTEYVVPLSRYVLFCRPVFLLLARGIFSVQAGGRRRIVNGESL